MVLSRMLGKFVRKRNTMDASEFKEGDNVYHNVFKYGVIKKVSKSSIAVEFESGKISNIKNPKLLEKREEGGWKTIEYTHKDRISVFFQSSKTGDLYIEVPFTVSYFNELMNLRYIEQYGERYYKSQMYIDFKKEDTYNEAYFRVRFVNRAYFYVYFHFETLSFKRSSFVKLYKRVVSGIEMKDWKKFVRDRYHEDVKIIRKITDKP